MQTARATRQRASSGPERLLEPSGGDAQSRRQPKKQTAQKRSCQRKNPYVPIKLDLLRARQAARPEGHKRAKAARRKQDAERAPRQTQDRALGQALACEARTARSERGAHREFALA